MKRPLHVETHNDNSPRSVGRDVLLARSSPRRIALGFVGAGALLATFLSVVGTRSILRELSVVEPLPFTLGLLGPLVALFAWSEVLARLLDVGGGRRFRLAFLAGDFTKQVLPMGHASGPVITTLAVSSVLGREYDNTLAAVSVTELLNLSASLVVATLGLLLLAVVRGGTFLWSFALLLVAVSFVVVALAWIVWARRPLVERALGAIGGVARRITRRTGSQLGDLFSPSRVGATVDDYYETLAVLVADRRRIATAGAFALVGWFAFAFPLYAAAVALDLHVPVGLALFAVPVAGLVTWLPVPGGVGGVEAALAALIVLGAGVDSGAAAAVAILSRLCTYWFVLAVDGAGVAVLSATE